MDSNSFVETFKDYAYINSVLWYVIYCILLYAFVGQYIEYTKICDTSNMKF